MLQRRIFISFKFLLSKRFHYFKCFFTFCYYKTISLFQLHTNNTHLHKGSRFLAPNLVPGIVSIRYSRCAFRFWRNSLFREFPARCVDKVLEDSPGRKRNARMVIDHRRVKYVFSPGECWPLIERSPEISFSAKLRHGRLWKYTSRSRTM